MHSTSIRQSLAQRARIILLSAQGQTAQSIAELVGVSSRAVFKWRQRFHAQGLSGLHDAPRPGQPRKLSAATVKKVLQMTSERVPREATHWSTRLMARYGGVTQWQVRQIWAAADLQPHRLETFKLSNDPCFAEKVVDVVGLYLDPPDIERTQQRNRVARLSARRRRLRTLAKLGIDPDTLILCDQCSL